MGNWSLNDVPWDRFDPSAVDPDIVPVVRAASLVEYNAEDYRSYLNNVFSDDPKMLAAVNNWASEEVLHGLALARWAAMIDPEFDLEDRLQRFRSVYRMPFDADCSVRGSRTGELVARCMVETGTNSFYSALADASKEPVLKDICQKIANDEYAHYHLFFRGMQRYRDIENLSWSGRIKVALQRLAEAEDDELAGAYWAANCDDTRYQRRINAVAYRRKAMRFYKPQHVREAVNMILRAMGLGSTGPVGWLAVQTARAYLWVKGRLLPRCEAIGVRLMGSRSAMAGDRT